MHYSSFYAGHIIKLNVRHGAADAQTFRAINGVVTALIARYLAGLAGIKMVLPCGALNNLTGFGNSETLGGCFVCLKFSHI